MKKIIKLNEAELTNVIKRVITESEGLTRNEALSSLCYYDRRNPDAPDDETIEDHENMIKRKSKKFGYDKSCSCDNCFYGRTKLAQELLKYI
jgi:hypothetical protein